MAPQSEKFSISMKDLFGNSITLDTTHTYTNTYTHRNTHMHRRKEGE